MPQIIVRNEREKERAWEFDVILKDAGQRLEYHVSLSWSDYDLWCHGRTAPEMVVQAAFRFLLDREPARAILRQFDCAVMRRYFPEVDRELPRYLGQTDAAGQEPSA